MFSVYCHTFPNGKKYIGISKDAEKRWGVNGSGYNTQPKMARAIKKYGWDNVEHEIIVDGLEKEQAEKLEIYLISELDTIENGYNSTIGGDNINSTYLNEHILLMIRESKRFDELYGHKQAEDDIVSLAEKAKYDKTAARIFNQLDKKVQEEYNEYEQWHGKSAMEDLACRRVDCYWWTMFQLLFYGKPQKTYCDYVYEITFGR